MSRSKTHAVAFAAVAALGLGTGCEKPSPIVTITAGGVVVKAHATKYCRPGENPNTPGECNESKHVPTLKVKAGDILGIDVPRSVAEHGWRSPQLDQEPGAFSYDHYRGFPLGNIPAGEPVPLVIQRDPKHGEGEWRFLLQVH